MPTYAFLQMNASRFPLSGVSGMPDLKCLKSDIFVKDVQTDMYWSLLGMKVASS